MLDLPPEFLTDPQLGRGSDAGRDGCRVPLPWAGERPPFGFGECESAWLPIPPAWRALTVEAQRRDPDSTLSLYTSALAFRRRHPALGDGVLAWADSPEGTLHLRREPGFHCQVNLTGAEVVLPCSGEVVLASGEVRREGGAVRLPADTAVWWVESPDAREE